MCLRSDTELIPSWKDVFLRCHPAAVRTKSNHNFGKKYELLSSFLSVQPRKL